MSDSIKAKFKLFRALCGEASLPSVLLVTTMWDSIGSTDHGMRRHVELIQRVDCWSEMIAGGSQTRRYLGDKDSAIRILSDFCEREVKTVLAIQRQFISSGDLSMTDAGCELQHKTIDRIEAYEKCLIDLEGQMRRAVEDNDERQCTDLAAVRDSYSSKLNAAIAARDGLTISLLDLYHQKEADDLRVQESPPERARQALRQTFLAQSVEKVRRVLEREKIQRARFVQLFQERIQRERARSAHSYKERIQLERARFSELEQERRQREMELLERARFSQFEQEQRQQEMDLLERACLFQLETERTLREETCRARAELDRETKQLQEATIVRNRAEYEARLEEFRSLRGQLEASKVAAAAAAAGTVVAAACVVM